MDEQIKTLLFVYFSGKYSPEDEAQVLEWLETDEKNKELFAEMAEWWATVHVPVFLSDMQSDFESRFWKQIPIPETNAKKSITFFHFFIRAAAVILVMVVGSLCYFVGKETGRLDSEVYRYETYVPYGSQSQVTLPDQSKVWLNAGSTFIYKEETQGGPRQITLEGEAYFEIITDSVRPLMINSENIVVKVKGTCFNIKAYKDDDVIDITLVQGKIRVQVETDEEVELEPNKQLCYNKQTNQTDILHVNAKDMFAWKNGVFKFRHQTFTQIAKILERKYNIQIHIQSEVLKREIFTGSFSANYSLEHILREIDIDKKYQWSYVGSEVIIRDK